MSENLTEDTFSRGVPQKINDTFASIEKSKNQRTSWILLTELPAFSLHHLTDLTYRFRLRNHYFHAGLIFAYSAPVKIRELKSLAKFIRMDIIKLSGF